MLSRSPVPLYPPSHTSAASLQSRPALHPTTSAVARRPVPSPQTALATCCSPTGVRCPCTPRAQGASGLPALPMLGQPALLGWKCWAADLLQLISWHLLPKDFPPPHSVVDSADLSPVQSTELECTTTPGGTPSPGEPTSPLREGAHGVHVGMGSTALHSLTHLCGWAAVAHLLLHWAQEGAVMRQARLLPRSSWKTG